MTGKPREGALEIATRIESMLKRLRREDEFTESRQLMHKYGKELTQILTEDFPRLKECFAEDVGAPAEGRTYLFEFSYKLIYAQSNVVVQGSYHSWNNFPLPPAPKDFDQVLKLTEKDLRERFNHYGPCDTVNLVLSYVHRFDRMYESHEFPTY